MGQFQDRSLLLEECPRRRGGCRAGARPCAPECQWHRRRRRRGGCCSGARQPCGAAVPGSRGPSPGTPSWRRMVRMQPRRHDGSIGLWNNPCNVKMSGVAYCSKLPGQTHSKSRHRWKPLNTVGAGHGAQVGRYRNRLIQTGQRQNCPLVPRSKLECVCPVQAPRLYNNFCPGWYHLSSQCGRGTHYARYLYTPFPEFQVFAGRQG